MNRSDSPEHRHDLPAIRRLAAVAKLDAEAVALLEKAAAKATSLPPQRELMIERRRISSPLLLLQGWAARIRIVPDGRRQLISFVLPGDIVGNSGIDAPVAVSTVVALTPVMVCQLPQPGTSRLERVYAISRALDEAYLIAQVVRLGRFDAADRLIDLLLELHERLAPAGLASGGQFDVPLTQEVLADVLGLTSVHVNRMVQQARKRGDLAWTDRSVRLIDMDGLRCSVGRETTMVA